MEQSELRCRLKWLRRRLLRSFELRRCVSDRASKCRSRVWSLVAHSRVSIVAAALCCSVAAAVEVAAIALSLA